ncbi:MAG TPA: PLDc N-terminal domain-containing protein [Gemmatimonadaceae bacterium]|nr:PLDc N-terminal domain-containing protein [Gemmatimonadaceae bacterium]
MFSLALVVIAAGVLSVLVLGFVVPIWAVVDCAISKSDTARKILWIVAIIVTGGLAAIAYAFVSRSSALKRTTAVSLLAFPAMVVIFIVSGMTLPVHPRSVVRELSKSPLSLATGTRASKTRNAGTKAPGTTASNAAGETVIQAGSPAPANPNVSRLAETADRFRLRRQWPAAIAAYDSILKFTPNAPDVLLARGDIKASACDSTGADHDFRAAIGGAIKRMNADSLDPQAIFWQGVGLHRLGDYMNAHVMVREAVHLDSLRGAPRTMDYRRELHSIVLDSATARTRKPACGGNRQA